MDRAKMKGFDLLTSLSLITFSIWGLSESFKMPMTATYGGVKNAWYVSPALFPLIINGGLLILGSSLFFSALKQKGIAILKAHYAESIQKKFTGLSEESQKFLVILLYICGLAYVLIPHIDFYLSLSLFLLMFCSSFFFEDMSLLRKLGFSFFILTLFLVVLKATGLMSALNKAFDYSMDVGVLVFQIIMIAIVALYFRGDGEKEKKLRKVCLVSYLSPLFLIIVFKYLLLIPMPKEGGFIELMNLVYYSVR